jgi:predicted DNA-binding transcriptional regulator AlpA
MESPQSVDDSGSSSNDVAVDRRNTMLCAPRLLRPRAAHAYLAMNKNQFNTLVRPGVTVIALGKRAIAFDRLELDAWAEDYCRRNGRSSPQQEEMYDRWASTPCKLRAPPETFTTTSGTRPTVRAMNAR